MIQPTELRVLNWILDNGIQRKITGISLNEINNYVYLDDYVTKRGYYGIDPISLTPEILEKCGAIKKENRWRLNGYNFFYDDSDAPGIVGDIRIDINNSLILIKSLHHLQNLIFALTGEELNTDL